MSQNQSEIRKIENGRVEFAYKCAEEGKKIAQVSEIGGVFYKDGKYKSYVKKIPTMIISNGLGQTLAFIHSKRCKKIERIKENGQEIEIKPGERERNPKNAYDLIENQLIRYFKNKAINIKMPQDKEDFCSWVISLDTKSYQVVTNEVLALFNWIKRFAEGMIEEEEE